MPRKKKEETTEEKIGYGQPPKSTQFQKGDCKESGNPKGRPKGTSHSLENLRTILKKGLEEKMTIQEKGEAKKRGNNDLYIL